MFITKPQQNTHISLHYPIYTVNTYRFYVCIYIYIYCPMYIRLSIIDFHDPILFYFHLGTSRLI